MDIKALWSACLLSSVSGPLAGGKGTGMEVEGPGRGTSGWVEVEASVGDAGKAAGDDSCWFCTARES